MSNLSSNFEARVVDGQLDFYRKQELSNFLSTLQGDVWVTIEKLNTKRTLSQNAYLWGVVYPLVATHTGNSTTEIHEIFKRMFLPPQFITYQGNEVKIAGSTADLDKNGFSEYLERIRAEAGNMGIIIPDPS